MRHLSLSLLGVLLGTCTCLGQEKPETIAITLQGNGNCTTRPLSVHDNWNIEVAADAPIKVDAASVDGSAPTTLINLPAAIPPPPSYTSTSASQAKGGTYSLTVTATGTWQITMIESGFTKNLAIGGVPAASALPTAAASSFTPSVHTTYINGIPSPMPGSPGSSRPNDHLIAAYNGDGPQPSTQPFTVQGVWDLLWNGMGATKITLVPSDGSLSTVIVNGDLPPGMDSSTNPNPNPAFRMAMEHMLRRGTVHQMTGGTFTLVVESQGPWSVQILQPRDGSSQVSIGTQSNASTGSPGPNGAPATPATPAPIVKLSDDQTRAVVLIKGDNGEGTGFLVKMPDGPVVVTNIHVIADNPNLKITTNTGAVIPMISAKGASDRDLALLSIKDAGYSYLTLCPDISKTVQTGDEVVTPGNSLGGEVMLNTGGKVLGIGPEKIEIDNPIYHGNSGGPIFHTKSGQVLGVVTEGMKVNTSNQLDGNSFANHNSAITGSIRYFGMRLDNVPSWIPIDWDRFQTEALFLSQFHEQSRRLDSYLNTADSDTSDFARCYLKDEKIMKSNDTYRQNVDTDGRVASLKRLVFDLQGIADRDMDQIQIANNFYSFDQERAQDELEYRKALKKELDSIGDNADRLKGRQGSN